MITSNKKTAKVDVLYGLIFAGIMILVLAVILTFGQTIVGTFKSTACTSGTFDVDLNTCATCSSGYAYNSTGNDCYNVTDPTDTIAYVSDNNYEFNTSVGGQEGIDNISQKQQLLGLIIITIAIISLVMTIVVMKRK